MGVDPMAAGPLGGPGPDLRLPPYPAHPCRAVRELNWVRVPQFPSVLSHSSSGGLEAGGRTSSLFPALRQDQGQNAGIPFPMMQPAKAVNKS